MAATTKHPITVHYNGACPICRPEVEHYKAHAARHRVGGVAFSDITSEAGATALAACGIGRESAARRFTVIRADGAVLTGVPAFAELWSRLPRYRWLAHAVRLPVLRPLAVALYDHVLAPLLFWSNRRAGRV